MTKKEENLPNSSFKFKIKITPREFIPLQNVKPLNPGLYAQMGKNGNLKKYTRLSAEEIGKIFNEAFYNDAVKRQSESGSGLRKVKIYTGEKGLEEFHQALKVSYDDPF